MKNNFRLLVLLLLFILLISTASFANENTINIHYFGTKACMSCLKTEKHIESILTDTRKDNPSISFKFIYHDTLDKENEKLLVKYNNYFNIKKDKFKLIPAIFIGNDVLIGENEIRESFESILKYYVLNISDYKDVDVSNSSAKVNKLTITGIMLAGLLDGINPCSIAMMLFFISFILMSKDNINKRKILLLSLSFVLGTFLAYLGIGIGIFRFIYSFSKINLMMKGFYLILGIMGLYLAYLNIIDYKNIKNEKDEKIKNQLNKKTKKKIHSIIKKYNNNGKILYLTAFITAFMISFLEFFCTGQVYLPIITYMINNSDSVNHIFLLILYNVAFVIPLLFIAIFIYLGKEVLDISTVLVSKLHIIKIIGAIFFFGVAVYSFYQVLLI